MFDLMFIVIFLFYFFLDGVVFSMFMHTTELDLS